jgi:hypothetical protein
LQVFIVAEVFELVVPTIWNATYLHLCQLVLLIVGIIVTRTTSGCLLLLT